MTKVASITQTCNIPPRRLIYLFIFLLLSLKYYQTEDPYFKICWTTRRHSRYHHVIPTQITSLQQCKDYCEYELPECNFIVFDGPSTNLKCYYKNSSTPLNKSYFEIFSRVHTYMLDLDCSKNVTSCWTVKGDHFFGSDIGKINRPNGTLESCKKICIDEFPVCNGIMYNDIELGGRGCWVQVGESPLTFDQVAGLTTYVLNRTCLAYTTLTPLTTPTTVTTKSSVTTPTSVTKTSSVTIEISDSITSCWTVKGDHNFRGLHLKSKPNMNLLTCKNICIHENPDCDVINYWKLPDGKIECWVKTQAGPLDNFFPMLGITSYILNRTCITMSKSSVTTPTSVTTTYSVTTTSSVTMPYTVTTESFKLDIKSFFGKYYLYILTAVGSLLLFVSTGCGIAFCKRMSSTFSSEEPGT